MGLYGVASGVWRRNSLVAATAQTVDCDVAMVMVEVYLNRSVLDFLMLTFRCGGVVMVGEKVMSSQVRCTL